jgi:uncharacterized membrane protein
VFFSYLSFLNHDHFLTNGFDLGIFDYAAWNNLHGNFFPGLYVGETSLFAIHFQPILLPLGLVYLAWDDAKALLLIQSLVLAGGAIRYWLARQQLNLGRAGIWWFTYFPSAGSQLFEFHPVTLAAFYPCLLVSAQGNFGRFCSLAPRRPVKDVFLIVGIWDFIYLPRKGSTGPHRGIAAWLAFFF